MIDFIFISYIILPLLILILIVEQILSLFYRSVLIRQVV